MSWVAQANEPACPEFDSLTLDCEVSIEQTSSSGSSYTGNGEPAASVCVSKWAGVVPCEIGELRWDAAHQCYISLSYGLATALDDDYFVQRHRHNGIVVSCQLRAGYISWSDVPLWLPSLPPPPPNPEILVNQAIETMSVMASAMGVWPSGWFDENSQAKGAVGFQVWLWAENPSCLSSRTAVTGNGTVEATCDLDY
jgi:hypothetical protein